jgi:hypothetical protein
LEQKEQIDKRQVRTISNAPRRSVLVAPDAPRHWLLDFQRREFQKIEKSHVLATVSLPRC